MLQRDIKTWQQEFQKLIQEVKPYHTWTLKLDKSLIPNNLQPGWVQYQQWVFARFQCSLCSRSWASAQVHVLFHMHWSKRESAGWVRMRIFAQRCQKCIQPPFEMPKFTEENISRILKNLVIQILKRCYKEGFKSMQEVPTLKENYTEGRHDVDNCEACLQGFCAQSGLGLTTQLPKSLALPIIRSPSFEIPIHEPSSKKRSITEGTVPRGASHPVETRIQVPRSSENPYSHRAWNPKKMIAGFCGCLLILILIIVVVVVVVVKPNA